MKLNKWSVSEVDEMLPWELEVYSKMQSDYLEERAAEIEAAQKQYK